MDKSVFLDTAYILAIIIDNDKHHKAVLELSKIISSEHINIVTTELILVEIANSLSRLKFRNECIAIIEKLKMNSMVIKIDEKRFLSAWTLYKERNDKEWSLTDCYSFIVMKQFDIKQALTTDKHFEQAGFERLLK